MQRIPVYRPSPGLAAQYDILCIDTEFTRLPHPKEGIWSWAEQARVLSIGISALDQRTELATFYGTRKIDRSLKALCTPFVLQEVLPVLDTVPADVVAATDRDLVVSFQRFLRSRAAASGKAPLLAVDWLGDAYLIETLAKQHYEWLLLEGMAPIAAALGASFPATSVRHNALHDAQAIRVALIDITDM